MTSLEISGETLYGYDSLNRLISETTDRGIVSYFYDAIGHVIERRINGGDPTTYVYDKANRIRTITYRNKSVLYDYDVAGRLIKKTLPNGVAQGYNYDEANQLLSIVYKKSDGTQIDNVSYTYDENSNRITRNRQGAGSVTETPFTATYDASNRMLTYNGYPLTYDDNGNLTQRQTPVGTVTYNWDSKNQLISINGPNGTASFKYDAQGRRIEKTINGQTTSFLYDGPQAIAELQGSAIGATYHTGLQIDEVLARYTNTGNRTLLTDALGSVIALADDSGDAKTLYSYSPFGEVATTGEASDNSLQYTGRENDNTGLNYYRARYYDPQLKRFISEDPIGLDGGINVYAYVGNRPVNLKDPFGLYGTTSCTYYDVMCSMTDSYYYCYAASTVCNNFPDLPTNWDECVRQCLQDYDNERCQPQSCDNPPKFSFTCTFVKAHAYCFTKCARDPNNNPFRQ